MDPVARRIAAKLRENFPDAIALVVRPASRSLAPWDNE
jgi:hypothetical protein